MLIERHCPVNRVYFRTVSPLTLAKSLDQPWPVHNNSTHYRRSVEVLADDWGGGIRSCQEAKALIHNGWPDGAARLKEVGQKLRGEDLPIAIDRKRRQVWADDGDTLDIDRAMQGQWDTAYRATKRKWLPNRMNVTIMASFGINYASDKNEYFATGAAMVYLADILQTAGYAVKLVACDLTGFHLTSAKSTYTSCNVVLKDFHEPLRLDLAASIVCHVGVYRSFVFSECRYTPDTIDGFGTSITWAKVKEPFTKANMWPQNTVMLDHATTIPGAMQCVRDALTLVQGKRQ